MKKVLCVIVVLIFIVGITACNPDSGAAPDEGTTPPSGGDEVSTDVETAPSGDDVLTLTMAHGHAPGSLLYEEYQVFLGALEEVSGGKIVVELHPGGSLLTDTETLQGVMDGVVDFVHAGATFSSGTVKDTGVLEMYGYWCGDDWQKLLTDIRPMFDKIFEPYGVKYVGSPYNGTNIILSDKQVLTPDDLQGLTFRSGGSWTGRCTEALGAAATSLPLTDVATALERGTVNGTINGWNLIYPWGLYELVPYISETYTANYHGMLLMNLDTWNSMTAEQQDWVIQAAYIFETETEVLGKDILADYKAKIEEGGYNTITYLTLEQQTAFLDKVRPLYDEMTELSDSGEQLKQYLLNELDIYRSSM